MPEPTEQSNNPLKDVPRVVIGSATLMFAAAICAGFVWVVVAGFAEMRSKDQRSREDVDRAREICRQDMDREFERYKSERIVTSDWQRKGQENVGQRLGALTTKIEELTAAVRKLERKGEDVGREVLPMPKEMRQ